MLDYLLDLLFPLPKALPNVGKNDLAKFLRTKPGPSQHLPSWIHSAFSYQDADIKKLIFHIKKYKDPPLISSLCLRIDEVLSEIESTYYTVHGISQTILVPIPLHHSSQRIRGFNQSHLLAKELAKNNSERKVHQLLRCVKKHPKQALLSRQERATNVMGIFKKNSRISIASTSLIVLIDDVTTTGATLKEAKKVLIPHTYIKNIIALTIAH